MKEIKAIIQPFMLSKVVKALQQIPEFPGMSTVEIKGFGRGKGINVSQSRNIAEDIIDFTPKTRILIVAMDDMVNEILSTIEKNAHTGNKGDGKIFVSDVEKALRIRTGERDSNAIWSPLGDE